MQGILLVDKPAGWTSFDVVNYVRKIVAAAEGKKPNNTKVGHTGTLDPFATGLLVLLIGKDYTRRASEFSKLSKTYEVTMRLGEVSSTGDPEGEITPYTGTDNFSMLSHKKVWIPREGTIKKTIGQFIGQVEQVPPAFSAVKVNGQRAYKMARAGKEVVLAPRKVTIHQLELVSYDYPEVKLLANVSSGTYIRTLVEDIGQALGTGAYTAALRRTKITNFDIANAVPVKDLTTEVIEQHLG